MSLGRIASCRSAGISLVELLVVIAILSVLASVLIPQITGAGGATERTLARRSLNMLNAAAGAFSQSERLLGDLIPAETANKEQAALALLYAYDPQAPIPGSPFLDPARIFTVTSVTNKYRARWNGRVFEWIERGTAGTGVDLE